MSLTPTTMPAYLYYQFKHGDAIGDGDIQAFIDYYNTKTQECIDLFYNLNLPVYTDKDGDILDFIGVNVFGIVRPSGYGDTEYKKLIEWHNYKADGYQFTVPWFKRRIARFIGGSTNDVNVEYKTVTSSNLLSWPNTYSLNEIQLNAFPPGGASAIVLRSKIKVTIITTPSISAMSIIFADFLSAGKIALPAGVFGNISITVI